MHACKEEEATSGSRRARRWLSDFLLLLSFGYCYNDQVSSLIPVECRLQSSNLAGHGGTKELGNVFTHCDTIDTHRKYK